MIEATYTLSPQSNTSEYMSWNGSYALSQQSGTPGTHQEWDFIYSSTLVCLESPRNSQYDVSYYIGVDSSGNIHQSISVDYRCLFTLTYSSGKYTFLNNVTGTYLGCNTSGVLTMESSVGSTCQWTLTSIANTYGRYSFAITPSTTTYYLQSSYDGYSLTTSTSVDTSNLSFQWGTQQLSIAGADYPPLGVLICCTQVSPLQYLKSNGDGTVGITSTSGNDVWWTAHQRGSTSSYVFAFQSYYGGYLIANSDNSTMGETTPGSPTYAGGLSSKGLFNLVTIPELFKRRRNNIEILLITPPIPRSLESVEERELTNGLKRLTFKKGNKFAEKLLQLEQLGFEDQDSNIHALVSAKGKVVDAVKILFE